MPTPPIFSVLLMVMMIAFLVVLQGLKSWFYSYFTGGES
jgi:hypothetical protein